MRSKTSRSPDAPTSITPITSLSTTTPKPLPLPFPSPILPLLPQRPQKQKTSEKEKNPSVPTIIATKVSPLSQSQNPGNLDFSETASLLSSNLSDESLSDLDEYLLDSTEQLELQSPGNSDANKHTKNRPHRRISTGSCDSKPKEPQPNSAIAAEGVTFGPKVAKDDHSLPLPQPQLPPRKTRRRRASRKLTLGDRLIDIYETTVGMIPFTIFVFLWKISRFVIVSHVPVHVFHISSLPLCIFQFTSMFPRFLFLCFL